MLFEITFVGVFDGLGNEDIPDRAKNLKTGFTKLLIRSTYMIRSAMILITKIFKFNRQYQHDTKDVRNFIFDTYVAHLQEASSL